MRGADRPKVGRYSLKGVKRSLENRLVFCANCDANRILGVSYSGNLICSSCGSENWMHVAVPLVSRFKQYNEQEALERVAVDRYIRRLEEEEFLTSNHALV